MLEVFIRKFIQRATFWHKNQVHGMYIANIHFLLYAFFFFFFFSKSTKNLYIPPLDLMHNYQKNRIPPPKNNNNNDHNNLFSYFQCHKDIH